MGGVVMVFYPVPVPGWMGGLGSTMTITGGGVESHLCGRSKLLDYNKNPE